MGGGTTRKRTGCISRLRDGLEPFRRHATQVSVSGGPRRSSVVRTPKKGVRPALQEQPLHRLLSLRAWVRSVRAVLGYRFIRSAFLTKLGSNTHTLQQRRFNKAAG